MGKKELDGIVGYASSCGMTAMLHCVAAYPAPLAEVNLALIKPDLFDGISDHSAYPMTGAFAVMRGARVVEVHCRLDETRKDNPDYAHSLPPARLKEYIANIRIAETMYGTDEKRVMPSEKALVKHRVTA
jgi:N-acetylneuraminate synthase/N,N'-diacetyllegionaminate synthase